MQQIKQMVWAAALALISVSAFAEVYIGGGLYQSTVDDSFDGETIDSDSTTMGVFLGYRPIENFAVEVGHYDLGNFKTDSGLEGSASGPTLGVNAILPMKVVDVYAKAGMMFITWTGGEDKTTEPYYGLGANLNVGSVLDVYLEYVSVDADFQSDLIGAGVRVNF